jgi:SpoVK/Ycf46/Vps4 family AAA+-type ATPase
MDGVPTRKFLEKLEQSTKDRLKIIVFEEAVSLLESSEDIREMLDFLDGARSVSNAIYFLSTNYPESIPENVIRNGRIDVFVKVDYPDVSARKKLIKLYLKRDANEAELATTQDMPIVDIRQICFIHKKTGKSFSDCVKIVEDKNKMIKKYFGRTKEIRLA